MAKTLDFDLTIFGGFEFYAGRPKIASETELKWRGHDYSCRVESGSDGIFAEMNSGQMVWRCPIDPENFIQDVDGALEDACNLGRIANWSNDE